MKYYPSKLFHLAAGGVIILAALFISGCGTEAVPGPAKLAPTAAGEIVTPPAPSPTPAPLPTNTPAATATSSPTPPVKPTTPPPSPAASTTVPPTPIPTSPPTGQAVTAGAVQVSTTTISLPTYPIWDFLEERVDSVYNIPVFYFNRPAYEAVGPAPTPRDYQAVVLENLYLRLAFLPELGGRLYSAVVKATGQEIFYHNPVVKPSRYGVLQPYEANWWLAAGGMEWAYPTQEHGYRFGVPWQYTVEQSAEGAEIILSDVAAGRVGAEVRVFLPADRATFTVKPSLTNATSQAAPVQFWLNAALTLGSTSMSPQTQFMLPVDKVTVHSRGEAGWTVPGERQECPWPLVGETDLRDYGRWANYLGAFAPNINAPFTGAYNPETNLGVARLVEPGTVPGNKLFAFGKDFPDKSYTDDGSQYFELWGGANTGFWPEADVVVPAGGTLTWQEQWWPLAGLGGLTWANQHAAIYLNPSGDGSSLSLLVAYPMQGTITVLSGETSLLSESFDFDPQTSRRWNLPASTEPVQVQLTDNAGNVLLNYK